MKFPCIVLYARPYSVADERTGVINEGISINYLTTDSLAPLKDGDILGLKPCKDSMPLEAFSLFQAVPGLYDLEFSVSVGSNGKPQMKLKSAKFLKSLG